MALVIRYDVFLKGQEYGYVRDFKGGGPSALAFT